MVLKGRVIDRTLSAMLGEGFFSRLGFGIIDFALPLYAYQMGLGVGVIGILISINLVFEMLLKPLLAPLADRYGAKRILGSATALRGVVPLLFAFSVLPWHLFAVRILHGASEAMRDPSVNMIISDRGGERRIATSYSWYNTAKVAAGALGKAAAGFLLTATLSDYRLVFLLAFGISLIPFFVILRYVEEERHEPPTRSSESERSWREQAYGKTAVMRSFGFGITITGTATMITTLFPLIATKYAGLSEAETGSIYIASVFVMIFAGPLFGWLSDNVSRRLVLLTRSAANALSSLLYILFPAFWGVLAGRILDDAGKSAFRPAWGTIMAQVSSLDKSQRARILGYMGLAENIGETAGPFLGGFLWQTWGVVVMLAIRAVLALISEFYAAAATRAIERNRRTQIAPEKGGPGRPNEEDRTGGNRGAKS